MIVSAAEFRRNIGSYQDRALTEPVFVSRNGRERIVLLSIDEYQRLEQRGGDAQAPVGQSSAFSELETVLASSDVATVVLDRDFNIRYFTPPARSLFGVIATDIGRPITDLARRFDDPDLLADMRALIEDAAPRSRKVTGENGTCLIRRVLPYRSAADRLDGLVITFSDISEITSAEREADAARAVYAGLFDAIDLPVAVLDAGLRPILANRAFRQLYPEGSAPAADEPLTEPGSPFASADFAAALARFAVGKAASIPDVTIDVPQTGRRTFHPTVRQMADATAGHQQITLALEDIAERKRLSDALESAKRQLEQTILNKTRILSAASHDLRQPLQTLNLLLGILAKKTKEEAALTLIAKIEETLVAMAGMLNTLFELNQLEAGSIRPDVISFSIGPLLDELKTEFAYHAEVAGLDWRVVGCRQKVFSDPRILEQIMRNLLSNAVKYTQRGKVLVGCRRRGDKLRIEVRDTGIGMAEDQARLIADKFRHADTPNGDRAFGLGLSVVQRLAALLGHSIDVRSRLGAGSTFAVEVDLDGEPARPLRAPAPVPAGTAVDGPILVVEDDPAIREMLSLTLAGEGYRTAAVADGGAAMELTGRGLSQPCLVITDLSLPDGRSGLEAIASLRAARPHPLPAIVLTGDTSARILRDISRHDCTHLCKPIKSQELLTEVRRLIGPRPPEAKQTARPAAQPGPEKPAIFVVDDDHALRDAMHDLLSEHGWEVELYASSEAFIEARRSTAKGCLLVDARLPGMGGMELLKWLHGQGSRLPAVMMTGYGDVAMAVEAMKAGATDFIEKPVHPDDLLTAITRALEQSGDQTLVTARNEAAAKKIATLTPRERQVMDMVLAGHPSKNIAADLGISQRTVENHRAAIMKKTGSRSIPALIRLALAATN
jgi:two-component system CheB/CheR fusion protein